MASRQQKLHEGQEPSAFTGIALAAIWDSHDWLFHYQEMVTLGFLREWCSFGARLRQVIARGQKRGQGGVGLGPC
jgi:hypothetical protein